MEFEIQEVPEIEGDDEDCKDKSEEYQTSLSVESECKENSSSSKQSTR